MSEKWKVQIFGERLSSSWEISVVRLDNEHGQKSWGWFDERKLLVSHNGGPCRWPICGLVWDRQVQAAIDLRDALNSGTYKPEKQITEDSEDMFGDEPDE